MEQFEQLKKDGRSKNGGARPNSGPVKGTMYRPALEKEALRKVIYTFVEKNSDGILEAMLDKAVGIQLKEEGQARAYKQAPDPQAAKLLLEYAIGKPKESIDHTSMGEKMNSVVNVNYLTPRENDDNDQANT